MQRTLVSFALLAFVQASFDPASARADDLLAGVAVRNITPDPLLPLSGGMGPTTPAKSKQGELEVRALVFKKGSESLAIVSVDLLGFPSALGRRVFAKVPRLKPECILIGASHTHSGPDCYAFPDGKGGHTADLRYLDFVCDRAAAAINEALDKLEPAQLRIATGEAKGKIAYNYYAPDLYDRRVSVIQAVRPAGGAIATLVNYAIHPEVLGAKSGILSPRPRRPAVRSRRRERRRRLPLHERRSGRHDHRRQSRLLHDSATRARLLGRQELVGRVRPHRKHARR